MSEGEYTANQMMDEFRELALDFWRQRWAREHSEAEMEEAIEADSSEGGHPYWTEPYVDSEYAALVVATCDTLARHFANAPSVVVELRRIGDAACAMMDAT